MTVQTAAKKYALFIDGEWRQAASGETTERLNPADQSPVADTADGDGKRPRRGRRGGAKGV